ncbi:hypothetical protein AJ88_45215 [Mesorhizobium amorphae CCBAU 01583]|nr:hypothetical protein AJ88_45215 [Mesorhizobium amorphae CCBAU 01583]
MQRRLFLVGPAALVDAVVDRERAPQMAVRKDRNRQERLDVLLFEVGSEKAFQIARMAGEDLALALVLGQPLQQRIRIDDRLHDDRRRCQFAAEVGVDPVSRDRLGKALARQFAQAEQNAALATHGVAQRLQDGLHLALPVAGLAQPANDADCRHRGALAVALHVRVCFVGSHDRNYPKATLIDYGIQRISPKIDADFR